MKLIKQNLRLYVRHILYDCITRVSEFDIENLQLKPFYFLHLGGYMLKA